MTGLTPTPPQDADLALQVALLRLGRELGLIGRACAGVQRALSICSFCPGTDPEAIRGLQDIDRITQSLEDLARMAQYMGKVCPIEPRLSRTALAAQARLHDIADFIAPSDAPHQVNISDAGDVAWF